MADPNLGAPTSGPQTQDYPGVNTHSLWLASPHQVAVRSLGGDLGSPNYFQTVEVKRHDDNPPSGGGIPGNIVLIVGGMDWPRPTDWSYLAPQPAPRTYYFGSLYHLDGRWRWSGGRMRVTRQYFQNGLKDTVFYSNDSRGRSDYIIDIVTLWSRSMQFRVEEAEGDQLTAKIEALSEELR